MIKYVRKYTLCLICGKDILRGKYCLQHRRIAALRRRRQYSRRYYQQITKKKRKINKKFWPEEQGWN